MIDTFQLSTTFTNSPDFAELINLGWIPLSHNSKGEITKMRFNSAKHEKKPRLTLSQNRNEFWYLRAEISLGSWLFGSNLCVLSDEQIQFGLTALSNYVQENSKIPFDSVNARVSRVDYFQDFRIPENGIIPTIRRFAQLHISKYETICYGNTSVYFRNSGQRKNKTIKIYSKSSERQNKSKNEIEIENAKGLVRLEISFEKNAVNLLSKSLGFEYHFAKFLLTNKVSSQVIELTKQKINFEKLFKIESFYFEDLFDGRTFSEASKLFTFLSLRGKFGDDYTKFERCGISKRTCQRIWKKCLELGVLVLE